MTFFQKLTVKMHKIDNYYDLSLPDNIEFIPKEKYNFKDFLSYLPLTIFHLFGCVISEIIDIISKTIKYLLNVIKK